MDPLAPKAAEKFGRYELVARLGVGGMAEVWLAQISGVSGFKKTLVLKTMHPNLAESPEFVKMFIKEASVAARLNHPNIVQIFDLGEIDSRYFIAMEYIPGRSLRQIRARLRKQEGEAQTTFPRWFLLNAVLRVCDGLHYSHEFCDADGTHLGLVHRDISPENIMVSFAGGVKLLDFGVAKVSAAEKTIQGGTLVGKFGYMAPEQISGGRTDQRSDLFALGVILYELFTGARPFRGDNELSILKQTLDGRFTPPQEVDPSIHDDVARIVLRAMAFDPAQRYQDASEMQADILAHLIATGQLCDQNQMAIYVSSLFPESSEIPKHIRNALAGGGVPPSASLPPVREPVSTPIGSLPKTAASGVRQVTAPESAAKPSTPPPSLEIEVVLDWKELEAGDAIAEPERRPEPDPVPATTPAGTSPLPPPAQAEAAVPTPTRDVFVASRPAAPIPPDVFRAGSRMDAPPPTAADPFAFSARPTPTTLVDPFSIAASRPTPTGREEPTPPSAPAPLSSPPPAAAPDIFSASSPRASREARAPGALFTAPPEVPATPDVFGARAVRSKEDDDLPSNPTVFGASRPSLPERSEAFAGLAKRPRAELAVVRPEPPRVHRWGPYEKLDGEAPAPPRAASAHFDSGLAHVRRQELHLALQEWERAVALEPENRSYQSNLQRLREKLRSK